MVINKTDLAPYVGSDLGVMERDAAHIRKGKPFFFAQVKHDKNVNGIAATLLDLAGLQ